MHLWHTHTHTRTHTRCVKTRNTLCTDSKTFSFVDALRQTIFLLFMFALSLWLLQVQSWSDPITKKKQRKNRGEKGANETDALVRISHSEPSSPTNEYTHIFCMSLCFTCHWRMWSFAGPFYDDIVLMNSSSTSDRHKMKIQRELFSFLIYKFIHDRRLNAFRRWDRSWRAHQNYQLLRQIRLLTSNVSVFRTRSCMYELLVPFDIKPMNLK